MPLTTKAAARTEKNLIAALATIESVWLQEKGRFLLGSNQPSIADLSLACEIMQLEVKRFSFFFSAVALQSFDSKHNCLLLRALFRTSLAQFRTVLNVAFLSISLYKCPVELNSSTYGKMTNALKIPYSKIRRGNHPVCVVSVSQSLLLYSHY